MEDTGGWVGLGEAARILGVHPATVRSWADRGHLPSQRTPGGHRRFRLNDLEYWMQNQKSSPVSEAQLMVQSAMGRARLEIGDGNLAEATWYRYLSPEARELMALYGRRLMEALQRYLASTSESVLPEVRDLGLKYGQAIRAQNLKLAQAVEGFYTFNDFVLDAMIKVIEMNRPVSDRSDTVRRVYAFTREIILALVDAYAD